MSQGSIDLPNGNYVPQVAPYAFSAAVAVTVAVTTTTARFAVLPGQSIRFSNSGATPIGVAFTAAATAITADTAMDIMPNAPEVFTVPQGMVWCAHIISSGTGTLKYSVGIGA